MIRCHGKLRGILMVLMVALSLGHTSTQAQNQGGLPSFNSLNSHEMDEAALDAAKQRLEEAEAEIMHQIAQPKESSANEAPSEQVKASLKSSTVPQPQTQPTLNDVSRGVAGEIETLHDKNASLKKKVSSQVKSIEALSKDNATLRLRLAASERQAETLSAKVKEMRNQLMLAETEIARLSSMLTERNRTTLARFTKDPGELGRSQAAADKPTLLSTAQQQKASEDMPIATVMVDNANLRSGPGKNNSPLMSVSKGTRLAVEARQGDWYRVIAPTGARAWIDAQIVVFGKDLESTPTRTVKVEGYDTSIEKQAFEYIRKDLSP